MNDMMICEDFPHINDGSERRFPHPYIRHSQGLVLGPQEWGKCLGLIVAKRMGRTEFDYVSNRSQSRPCAFIRQVVWSYLRFGMSVEVGFPAIGRIASCDHTTIIHGVRSLFCKIEHEKAVSNRFDEIARDIRADYPNVANVRIQMKHWALG